MSKLVYKIVTPERVVLEGEADSLTAMTSTGEITILPKHMPIATLLRAGEMRVKNGTKEETFAHSSGLLEVNEKGEIAILADSAEHAEELQLEAIEAAKARAEDTLKEARNRNDVGFADAAAHLERELARYRVALKGKKRIVKQAPSDK